MFDISISSCSNPKGHRFTHTHTRVRTQHSGHSIAPIEPFHSPESVQAVKYSAFFLRLRQACLPHLPGAGVGAWGLAPPGRVYSRAPRSAAAACKCHREWENERVACHVYGLLPLSWISAGFLFLVWFHSARCTSVQSFSVACRAFHLTPEIKESIDRRRVVQPGTSSRRCGPPIARRQPPFINQRRNERPS